jgi:hypothetical protein
MEVYLHAFLTSALEVSGQRHAPAALPRKEGLSTHWIGGWVGLIAGLDVVEERKSFALVRNPTPIVRPSGP